MGREGVMTQRRKFSAEYKRDILLPLKLRPPSRHGPERTEEVAR